MTELTRDEALAFIESMRLTLSGKVGFRWLVEKLGSLSAYVESLSRENERLRQRLAAAGLETDPSDTSREP